MPHTWGGSEAEPVAAVPPCLLPPFDAGVVLTGFVDVATTVAFSVLGGAAISFEEEFFKKITATGGLAKRYGARYRTALLKMCPYHYVANSSVGPACYVKDDEGVVESLRTSFGLLSKGVFQGAVCCCGLGSRGNAKLSLL